MRFLRTKLKYYCVPTYFAYSVVGLTISDKLILHLNYSNENNVLMKLSIKTV